MKMGSFVVRLLAGLPVVAGICLTQGCSTTSSSSTPPELLVPVVTNVVPEVVEVNTNVVKVETVPAMPVNELPKEKAVLKSRPALTTPYKVKAGEGLMDIAAKYGKRWADVLAVNPELNQKSHLRIGQTIQLPNPVDLEHPKAVQKKKKATTSAAVKKPSAPVAAKSAAAKPADAKAAEAAGDGKYTVKKGDSVPTIAAAHHVKRAELIKANNLTDKSILQIGQKLVIPAKGESTAAPAPAAAAAPAAAPLEATPAAVVPPVDAGAIPPPPVEAVPAVGSTPAVPGAAVAPGAATVAPVAKVEPKTYTVKEGEDVYAVAIRWGVSPAELKALNNLTSADLQAGQVVKIPAVASPTP